MSNRRGFTLVELMVALVLLGLVMVLVFEIFASTSDTLKEADGLTDTLDRTRFAAERLSADLANAGSFGSPDSAYDPWVPSTTYDSAADEPLRVVGVASYDGWQNDHTLLAAQGQDDANKVTGESDPAFGFDGVVVMGAIDFPQSFEISQLSFAGNGRASGATISTTERGLYKLLVNDPFFTETGLPPGLITDSSTGSGVKVASAASVVTADLGERIMRVMDRNGNIQLSGIQSGASYSAPSGTPDTGGITFQFDNPLLVQNNEGDDSAGADYGVGLQRSTIDDSDVGYDATLIDAFWYHVEQDPRDPYNFRLVRERLDAQSVAAQLATDPAGLTAANLSATYASGDKVVISDRVVDFQVWFDCADSNGNLDNASWLETWSNPGGGDTCVNPTGTPQYGEARMGHIRLSVRGRYERKSAPDDADAFFMDAQGNIDASRAPHFFDVYPDAKGSARVVTVQTDVNMNNFAMRNIH